MELNQDGIKVFGIGMHKTGTTTLDVALTKLGYSVCSVRHDILPHIKSNNFDPVWQVVNDYDAFQDNPWPLLYKELDAKFPGSKFIFTFRDEKSWIDSVVNHFGEVETEMRKWIYGAGCPIGNQEAYLKKYRAHRSEVLQYFRNRSDDFIAISWQEGAGWKELCDFLKKPIIKEPFPHANKGVYR